MRQNLISENWDNVVNSKVSGKKKVATKNMSEIRNLGVSRYVTTVPSLLLVRYL